MGKLYTIAAVLTSLFAFCIAGDMLYRKTIKPKKQTAEVQAPKNQVKQASDLDKTVNDSLPETKPEPKIKPIAETLPIYKGYEKQILQKYDNMIIDICNNLENKTQIDGIKAPPKDLVKKIILIETAYKGEPVDEFETDPGQTKKDNAYNFAVNGADEGFYPENGFEFLKDSSDVEKTIWAEAIYLAHLASAYEEREILVSDKTKDYIIQSEDSIFNISQEFRKNGFETTQEAIIRLNKIKNPNLIQPGKKLKIPNVKKQRVITSIDFSDQKALAISYNGSGDPDYGSKFDSLKKMK